MFLQASEEHVRYMIYNFFFLQSKWNWILLSKILQIHIYILKPITLPSFVSLPLFQLMILLEWVFVEARHLKQTLGKLIKFNLVSVLPCLSWPSDSRHSGHPYHVMLLNWLRVSLSRTNRENQTRSCSNRCYCSLSWWKALDEGCMMCLVWAGVFKQKLCKVGSLMWIGFLRLSKGKIEVRKLRLEKQIGREQYCFHWFNS